MTNSRLLFVLVASSSLGVSCFWPVDVGADQRPLSNNTADGGIFGASTVDGGVACTSTCLPVDAGPQCAGDLTIASAADWAAFEALGCAHFNGNLTITSSDSLAAQDDLLQTVSGQLLFMHTGGLTSVRLTALQTVGQHLDFALAGALTSVELPSLTSSGGMSVVGVASLTGFSAPVLSEMRGDLMVDGTALSTLDLPALTTVRGGNVTIANDSALTAVLLPALLTGGNNFVVRDNALLTELRLPALQRAEIGFYVRDNPQLRQCLVDAIHLHLDPGVDYAASGNAGLPNVCP